MTPGSVTGGTVTAGTGTFGSGMSGAGTIRAGVEVVASIFGELAAGRTSGALRGVATARGSARPNHAQRRDARSLAGHF